MDRGADCDRLLVERAQAGESHAFDLLVQRYERRVLRLIARLVPGRMEAEDVAQDTFLRAYRNLGQFRGEAKFFTWLYRIAINSAKDFLRRKAEYDVTFSENELIDGPPPPSCEACHLDTPDGILMSKEIAYEVYAALNALTVDIRAAILLRELAGMSYKEIALTLGCPVGTVRSRVFRAREFMAGRLERVSECGLARDAPHCACAETPPG